MRGGIDHVILTIRHRQASFALYDAVLRFLGYRLVGEDGDFFEWALESGTGSSSVGLVKAEGAGRTRRHDRYASGLHHLAWAAGSREDVNRLYELLVMMKA